MGRDHGRHRGRADQGLNRTVGNANPDKAYRIQPFGGTLNNYRIFDGFRVPTRVEGGNFLGTDAYFPFFKATVTEMQFL